MAVAVYIKQGSRGENMGKKKNRYAKYGYLFCLPFTIAFILFMLYPILYTLIIGFTDLKGLGMTNFKILEDP